MKELLSFWVEAEPRAKQSFRVGKGRGFTPQYIKNWQGKVGGTAQQAMMVNGFNEPFACHMTVTLIFFLGDARRIDLDNLSKAVQDGMNKIVWVDDQHNIKLVLDKYICREKQGVWVKVERNDRPVEVTAAQMPLIVMGTWLPLLEMEAS